MLQKPKITAKIGLKIVIPTSKSSREGSTSPKTRFSGLFFEIFGLTGMKIRKNESVEQGVAGYDPQVVAIRWLSIATIVILTARGSSPEP